MELGAQSGVTDTLQRPRRTLRPSVARPPCEIALAADCFPDLRHTYIVICVDCGVLWYTVHIAWLESAHGMPHEPPPDAQTISGQHPHRDPRAAVPGHSSSSCSAHGREILLCDSMLIAERTRRPKTRKEKAVSFGPLLSRVHVRHVSEIDFM